MLPGITSSAIFVVVGVPDHVSVSLTVFVLWPLFAEAISNVCVPAVTDGFAALFVRPFAVTHATKVVPAGNS